MADKEIKAEATVVLNTRDVDAAAQRVKRANDGVSKEAKKQAAQQAAEQKKLTQAQEREAKKRADAEARALAKQAADAKRTTDAQVREASRYQERLLKLKQAWAARQSQQSEREAKKAADAQEREAKKLSDAQAREAKRAADAQARESKRATDAMAREVSKRTQQELAEERKSLATRKKEWQAFWKATRGAAGAVVGGAVAGGIAAASSARSMAGVQDIQTRLGNARDFKERLIVTASQAGLSQGETNAAQNQILSTSQRTGVDAMQLLGVLEQGQARFNDLKFFADNLDKIATTAKASGADAQELAQAMGYVRQAFNLTSDESKQALDLMVAAAAKGSIEVKDFARDFAPVAGLFAQATGSKGLAGARQFFGTSQAAGTLGAGSAETATMVERLVQNFGEADIQKKMRSVAGIDVRGKSMEEIVAAMADSKRFNKLGAREAIFGKGDIITNKAITALISAYRRTKEGVAGAIDISTIANVNASEGQAQTAKNFGALADSGVLATQQEAARMQADTITNFKSLNDQVVSVVKAADDLALKFGDAGRSVELWSSSLAATGIGSAVGGFLAGGGGGGLMSAAGKLIGGAGAGSAATMSLGALASGGAVGLGALTAGATSAGIAGYSVGSWIDSKTGASDWLGKLMTSGVDAQRADQLRQGKQAPMSITPGEAAMIAEQRKSTAATKELAMRIPARPAQPGNGNRGAR